MFLTLKHCLLVVGFAQHLVLFPPVYSDLLRCLAVKCVVSGAEQQLSARMSQLTSHSTKVNEFPPCADFPFVSLRCHTEGIFNCALAVLQGQVDLMASQSASICPGGGGGISNSRRVLLSFSKELRLRSKRH